MKPDADNSAKSDPPDPVLRLARMARSVATLLGVSGFIAGGLTIALVRENLASGDRELWQIIGIGIVGAAASIGLLVTTNALRSAADDVQRSRGGPRW